MEQTPQKSRFQFKEVPAALFRPRTAFARLGQGAGSTWLTPMLILTLTLIIRILVGGYLQGVAAATGQAPLPDAWQWWTPEMQQQYMQAQSLTQGPVFLYVIPISLGLAGLWAGWGIVSGLLHLTSTLLGGRGSMKSALDVVAWGSLPFAVRDIIRVAYMLVVQHSINSPGLSGFVTITDATSTVFLSQMLAAVDIFWLWYLVLVGIGISERDSLSNRKAFGGAILVLLVVLLAQAGLGVLTSKMGGLLVTRPF